MLAYFKHAMRMNVKLLAEATRRNERNGYTTPPPQHPPSVSEPGVASSIPDERVSISGDPNGMLDVGEPPAGLANGSTGKRSKSLLSRRVQAKSSGTGAGGGEGPSWVPPLGTVTL